MSENQTHEVQREVLPIPNQPYAGSNSRCCWAECLGAASGCGGK